jgi:hypothetical protein
VDKKKGRDTPKDTPARLTCYRLSMTIARISSLDLMYPSALSWPSGADDAGGGILEGRLDFLKAVGG